MFHLNNVEIEDTYAELFELYVGRILITASSEKWALIAATTATGYGSSIIGSPAEAGIEGKVPKNETPDGRDGFLIQIYHRTRPELKREMIGRIGQCVMTCPTTAAFDALHRTQRKLKIGRSLQYFGDGFQKHDEFADREIWRIPVMEGEFIVENSFGVRKAVAGGNFLIFAKDEEKGLRSAEESVKKIRQTKGVIMPFPGGICRSGSKIGSLKYKLPASTNHPFCPRLKDLIDDTEVPKEVNCIYEIVINGLSLTAVEIAMAKGIEAATSIPGVSKISAGNYGGKIGKLKINIQEILK